MTDAATTTATEAGGSTAAPAQAPAATAATTATLLTGTPATTTTATGATAAVTPAPGTPEAEAAAKVAADAKVAEAKAAGAPEAYTDFTFAEGFDAQPEQVKAFTDVARELNLSQEQAQKLVSMQTTFAQQQADAMQEMAVKQRVAWTEATRADKEFGGAKIDESNAIGIMALNKFATPALRDYLHQTGLADHPEMFRFIYRVGKALGEDTHIQGGVTATPKSMAQRWYGDTMPQPPNN